MRSTQCKSHKSSKCASNLHSRTPDTSWRTLRYHFPLVCQSTSNHCRDPASRLRFHRQSQTLSLSFSLSRSVHLEAPADELFRFEIRVASYGQFRLVARDKLGDTQERNECGWRSETIGATVDESEKRKKKYQCIDARTEKKTKEHLL